MSKKLLFFDIDGTLVSFDGQIPPSSIEALKRTQKKGNDIFLCTGRSKNQIPRVLREFGFDGIVAATGAYVEYHGEKIFHNPFSKDNLRQVVDLFKDQSGAIIFQRTDDCLYDQASEPGFIRAYESNNMVLERLTDNPTFDAIKVDDDLDSYPDKYDDIESIIFCESEYTIDEIRERVNEEIRVESASYRSPEPHAGEITLRANNKEEGIRQVIKHLDKTREDVIAFGDGVNDLEMLDFAGYSVVMDNASDEVKEHGDYITDRVDRDGLYKAMEKLELI